MHHEIYGFEILQSTWGSYLDHPLISNLTPIFSVSPVDNDETVSTSEGDDSFAWMDVTFTSRTLSDNEYSQHCTNVTAMQVYELKDSSMTRAIASTNHPLISNLTPIFSVSPVGNDETVSTSASRTLSDNEYSQHCTNVTAMQVYELKDSSIHANEIPGRQ
jgi:hypothetical protein